MADNQHQLDSRALEKATEALTHIEVHEKTCDRRYLEISEGQKAIFKKIDGLGKLWLTVAGGIILILLAIIGFLIIKVMGW